MNHEQNTEGLDLGRLLGDFLKMAKRYFWLAPLLILIFSGFFFWKAKRDYHPVYEASATFTVYVASPLQAEVRGYNAATAEQMAKTFPYILTSGALKDLVMQDMGISALPAVTASVLNNTNIFTLAVTAGDPEFAYDVLCSVMEHYPEVAEFVVGPTVMSLLSESGVPAAPRNTPQYSDSINLGLVLGAGIWVTFILLLAISRSTVHNEEELGRLINVRCLCALPRVRRGRKNVQGCPVAGGEDEDRDFSESVRLLRIRAERELRNRDIRVLLISSATPGEGKTTVSVNLAHMMARQGKQVLLVDCDLRNPSVAEDLGLQNDLGLVDVLEEKQTWREVLKPGGEENLSVITAGGPSGQASELLSRPEGRTFLNDCREQFDCILLDTPPATLLADASEIAGAADGALMVVRQDYASRANIVECAERLSESGLPLIGCVFNYASGGMLGRSPGGYDYGYSYGYSYGYGRGERSQEKEKRDIKERNRG